MRQRLLLFWIPVLPLLFCTRMGPQRQWDNPLDADGINWFPPRVTAMGDTTVAISDTVMLRAVGSVENGSIIAYSWSLDTGRIWEESTGDALPVIWSLAQTGKHLVFVRARDSNGLVSSPDSVTIDVRTYAPVLQKVRDTVAGQQATVAVTVMAQDTNGTIDMYYWGGGTGGWIDSTRINTREFINPSGGPVTIIWGARDNHGLLSTDTFTILFNRGPLSASIDLGEDSIAALHSYSHINGTGTVRLGFRGADPDGDADTLRYSLWIGENMSALNPVYTGRHPSAVISDILPGRQYRWRLVVTDLFGDSTIGQGRFISGTAPPPPRGKVLVRAPSAPFMMGSSQCSDCPTHPVQLTHHFWIDSSEVTEADYCSALNLPPPVDRTLPVSGVTWFDAVLYCNARSKAEHMDTVYVYTGMSGQPGKGCILSGLRIDTSSAGYHLPTEAQWEYAARAGSSREYFWGDDPLLTGEYAWYRENSGNRPRPVMTRRPNALGLFDMCGNVWEWCQDWYGADYYDHTPDTDPSGPETGTLRVVRGGGYDASEYYAAVGVRNRFRPDMVNPAIGFRTVLPER
jgi:formylglycine-generating enzyme required for sulfatase activity